MSVDKRVSRQYSLTLTFRYLKIERKELHTLRVVVKCDIEGGELGVVTDMVVTGAMEVVDCFYIE